MNTRIALYSLGIGIIALSMAIYNHVAHGTAISPKGLLAGVILLPVFGFLLWLRHDWAVAEGRKRRAERAERKAREAEDKAS